MTLKSCLQSAIWYFGKTQNSLNCFGFACISPRKAPPHNVSNRSNGPWQGQDSAVSILEYVCSVQLELESLKPLCGHLCCTLHVMQSNHLLHSQAATGTSLHHYYYVCSSMPNTEGLPPPHTTTKPSEDDQCTYSAHRCFTGSVASF